MVVILHFDLISIVITDIYDINKIIIDINDILFL
jgi:hypothetical protein